MSDQEIVNFVIGIVLPLVVAIIMQRTWPDWLRALITYATVFLFSLGSAWFLETLDLGDNSPRAIVRAFLMMAVTAHASYKMIWQPMHVTQRIEDTTSR